MKKLPVLLLILCCTSLIGCSKGQQINGHNTRTVFRSVKALKNRLSPDARIEFEVSFWMLRDSIKSEQDFLNAVDGKNPKKSLHWAKNFISNGKITALQAMKSTQAGMI